MLYLVLAMLTVQTLHKVIQVLLLRGEKKLKTLPLWQKEDLPNDTGAPQTLQANTSM